MTEWEAWALGHSRKVLFQNLEVQMQGVCGWREVYVSHTNLPELKCLKSQLYSFRQREGEAYQELCPIPGPLKELSVGTAAPTAE